MHKCIKYISVICLLAALHGCSDGGRNVNLRETYDYLDKRPFGGYVAYHLLQNSYPEKTIQVKTNSFANTAAWISDTASVYINISRKFYVDEEDALALLDYVYKGNTAFIAAAEIDTLFLGKLFCEQVTFSDEQQYINNSFYVNTLTELVPALRNSADSQYQYLYLPFSNYFSKINDSYCRIAGYNAKKQANFIVFFWGKGRFYLHCDPRAFSNYFLLHKSNYQYAAQPFDVLPANPEHIFWDDHYNSLLHRRSDSSKASSFFDFMAEHPPLNTAFWILSWLLAIYIFLNGKRRQRIIPVIKPVQNSSVAFAEAIGGLYLKEKNNKTITDKMISYFNDSVRTKYFLNTSIINRDFLTSLSRKSGAPFDKTEILYRTMQQLSGMADISDSQLLDLNDQIQKFNQYKK